MQFCGHSSWLQGCTPACGSERCWFNVLVLGARFYYVVATFLEDWAAAKYTWPGSNWRPSACEADVIATRPQVLRNPGGGRGASVNASRPAWTHAQTRTWNLIQRLHNCSLQFRLEWGPAAKANRNKSHNCTCMRVVVAAVPHMALWPNG